MRILNITAQKPDSTGSGVYLANMVEAFHEAGHEQAVIAGIALEDTPTFPQDVRFEPVYFETPELPFPVVGMSDTMPYRATRYRDMTPEMVEQFDTAFISALDRVLASFDPDVIICHHLYLVARVVREYLPDKEMVGVCHSTEIRQMNQHRLERSRIIEAVRNIQVIAALHDEQRSEIIRVYGVEPSRVHVLGTGYDHRLFCRRATGVSACVSNSCGQNSGSHRNTDDTEALRASRAYGAQDKPSPRQSSASVLDEKTPPARLLFVGKVIKKKGAFSLIKALGILTHQGRAIHLRLAGGSNDSDEYARIQSLVAQTGVSAEFLGRLNPDRVAEEYCASDIFVLPSFFEGLPLVAVEALACGCKVVITDLPGIRSWIEAQIPHAPVVYVEPPRIDNVDEARESDLPAFERRLAGAIEEAITLECPDLDLEHLSWVGMSTRMLELVCFDEEGKTL